MLLMVLPWKLEPFFTLSRQPPWYWSVCLKAFVFHATNKVCKSQASLVSITTLLSKLSLVSISTVRSPSKKFKVTAVVVPCVTCDLPLHPIPFDLKWRHLEGIPLADPDFGLPGRIDILLGVDIFVEVLHRGRQTGSPGSLSTFETEFGWVLTGKLDVYAPSFSITSHHVSVVTGDDLLRTFWEIEECSKDRSYLTPEEWSVVQHFKDNHSWTEDGCFMFLCPRNHMLNYLANPDLSLWEGSSRWSDLYMPRSSLMNLMLWWMSTLRRGMLRNSLIWSGEVITRSFLSSHAYSQEGVKHDHKDQSCAWRFSEVFYWSLPKWYIVGWIYHSPIFLWCITLFSFTLCGSSIVPLNSPNPTGIYIGLFGEGIPRILYLTII